MSSPSLARQTTAASIASERPLRASTVPARRPSRSSIGTTSTPASSRATGVCLPLTLHQGHDIAVPAFDGDERARVQDKHQAAPRP